jgi:gluconolactonase
MPRPPVRSAPSRLVSARLAPTAPTVATAAALVGAVIAAGCASTPAPKPAPTSVASPARSAANGSDAAGGGQEALPDLAGATAPTAIPSSVRFDSLEGPFWVAQGQYLLFSDVVESNGPGAKIYRFTPGTGAVSVEPYPRTPTSTNGLGVDGRGRLVACERYNGRVVRLDDATHLTVLAQRWPEASGPDGKPLAAPNDLAIRADGNVYFTDSDWGTRTDLDHAAMAVYRIDPAGALSRILELTKPNGIALSPDGRQLYVGSDTQAKVWRLPLDAAGLPGAPMPFIDAGQVPGGFRVPDGICIDDAGALYVTNNDDILRSVVVFDPTGHPRARIRFPARPSNCTFGGPDRRTLFVTTLHAVYQLRVPVAGLP